MSFQTSTTNSNDSDQDQKDEAESLPLLPVKQPDQNTTTNIEDNADTNKPSHAILNFDVAPGLKYTWYIGMIFYLNYGVGIGSLALPYAFFQGGYILSSIILIWCTILNHCTFMYVLNLSIRTETLATLAIANGMSHTDLHDNPQGIQSFLRNSNITLSQLQSTHLQFHRNEFELNQIIGIFCGRKWRKFYEVGILINYFMVLWALVALLGMSLTRFAGISSISPSCDIEDHDNYNTSCRALYTLYCFLFWIWAMCFSLFDFKQQIIVQIFTFIYKVIIITLILISTIGLIYSNVSYSNNGKYDKTNSSNNGNYGEDIVAFNNLSGFFYCLMICTWSFPPCNIVPDITQPLDKKDKIFKQFYIYRIGQFIYFCVFLTTGIIISLYFGKKTEDPYTLAYEYFVGWNYVDREDRSNWSKLIAFLIVLLPCVDILTCFLLNVMTLANTLIQAVFNEDQQNDRKIMIMVRLGSVSITTILALLVWDFSSIIEVTGISFLLSAQLCTAYAEYKSQEMMKEIIGGGDGNDDDDVDGMDNNNINDELLEKSWKTPLSDWTLNKFWIYSIWVTVFVANVGIIIVWIVGV